MDNNENESGRQIIEKAIKEHSRKRDAEQMQEVQGIKVQKSKKSKTRKKKKNVHNTDSISPVHSDDPEIIKRRKTNMRKLEGRLSALGLQKIKPVKEKRNNNNTKPEPEELIKILQY